MESWPTRRPWISKTFIDNTWILLTSRQMCNWHFIYINSWFIELRVLVFQNCCCSFWIIQSNISLWWHSQVFFKRSGFWWDLFFNICWMSHLAFQVNILPNILSFFLIQRRHFPAWQLFKIQFFFPMWIWQVVISFIITLLILINWDELNFFPPKISFFEKSASSVVIWPLY